MKKYHVLITEIDVETGDENIELDEEYSSVTLLADNFHNEKSAEVILHDNVMNIASKIAASTTCSKAARLAEIMRIIDKSAKGNPVEDKLIDKINGGMQ